MRKSWKPGTRHRNRLEALGFSDERRRLRRRRFTLVHPDVILSEAQIPLDCATRGGGMASGKRPDPNSPPREPPPSPGRLSVPDPEDIGLPRARRNYVVPALIALAVFVLIVTARFLWG